MKTEEPAKPVERMYPFVLRSRALIVGRETLRRSKSKLHFVLITHDISETSKAEVLSDFAHYPVIQHYRAEDIERFFHINGTKVVGFKKSGLAQSIYAELKMHRINKPMVAKKPLDDSSAHVRGPKFPDLRPDLPGKNPTTQSGR